MQPFTEPEAAVTVFVDNMKLKARMWRWNASWSNLWADTTAELLDMADKLNLSRESLIDEGFTTERYLITNAKRTRAIELGAMGISYGGLTMHDIIARKRYEGRKEKNL